jgi:glyoxylase-like metal-dependent hydrolase (beta-lactamase superfamily II)/rhodanese-related sulfurtransferase
VFEQVGRDAALLRELGLALVTTLETHVHADHVTGAWLLAQRFGSQIALGAATHVDGADRLLHHADRIQFGSRWLEARATPGHTDGCLSYVLDDQSMAFTGDALLIRGCGRTDFQDGNAQRLYHSVHEQLLTLPAACLLYPAHDYRGLTVTSVVEERRFNPRLGGNASVTDFVGTMQALGLPHPKLIDVAVPANLRCGRPAPGSPPPPEEPDWAALTLSFAGVWQIEPDALQALGATVQIVDVREPSEWVDSLGHIPGAVLVPLDALVDRQSELDPHRPLVAVCRSGSRSAQACHRLTAAGFKCVANLAGGMLRWREQGHRVVRIDPTAAR